MRLLEFDNANSGANPQNEIVTRKHAKRPARKSNPRYHVAQNTHAQILPIHGNYVVRQPASRKPIDLEQLQQRIDVLERRMRERNSDQGGRLPVKDLEQLKQRMKLLERSVNNELWAAKQREHTLLELLTRTPLKKKISARAKHLSTQTLPATGRWCKAVGNEWWSDNQPLWWPRFARAWQQSLDKARGIQTG